jgi:peptidyl-prolyl cis-trans isomerase SurA
MDLRKSVLALALVAVAAATPARAEPVKRTVIDRVVAVVDQDVITLVELRQRAQPFLLRLASLDGAQRAAAESQMYKELVDAMVEERIVAAEARARSLSVTPAEVDAAVEAVAKQNGLSRDAVLQAAADQGMSEARYREELARQLLRHKVASVVAYPRVYKEHKGETIEALQKELEGAMRAWLDGKKSETWVEVRL